MKKNKMCFGMLILAASILAACGGGGGGGGATPSPSPAPTPTPTPTPGGGAGFPSTGTGGDSYLFYAGSLNAVDPASPDTPVVVESGDLVSDGFGAADAAAVTIHAGTYDSSTKSVTGAFTYAVIYAKPDGHFYKVSAQKGGTLTPVQVSNEAGANNMCLYSISMGPEAYSLTAFEDFADPNNSQIVYSLPGADATCTTPDDVWKMVRLNMSASDMPVAAMPPIAIMRDTGTGAISGWLVNDPDPASSIGFDIAGDVKRCDASFAACGSSVQTVSSMPRVMLGLGMNRFLLSIGVYDGNSNSLSTSPFVKSDTLAADDSDIYYESQTSLLDKSTSIFRVPVDGSLPASIVVTETVDIKNTQQLAVTDNKVIYAVNGTTSSGAQLRAVDKTGGTPVILASTDVVLSGVKFHVEGNKIFYTFFSDVTFFLQFKSIASGMVDEDGGNKSEFANALWGGSVLSDVANLDSSSRTSTSAIGISSNSSAAILIEGYEAMGSGRGFAGGTVKSFNPADGSEIATLGVLPNSTINSLLCWGIGSGDNALCGDNYKIFYLNGATADSLKPVNDTSVKSKFPVS